MLTLSCQPLLYSVGWNKQLNYCTAFSVDEAVDVTKRYIKGWPEVLKRRDKVNEAQLTLVKKIYVVIIHMEIHRLF